MAWQCRDAMLRRAGLALCMPVCAGGRTRTRNGSFPATCLLPNTLTSGLPGLPIPAAYAHTPSRKSGRKNMNRHCICRRSRGKGRMMGHACHVPPRQTRRTHPREQDTLRTPPAGSSLLLAVVAHSPRSGKHQQPGADHHRQRASQASYVKAAARALGRGPEATSAQGHHDRTAEDDGCCSSMA